MKTSLAHLPPEKLSLLKKITEAIVEKTDPEKIILFGSHATGKWIEDEYMEEGRLFDYKSDYDILVITKEGEQRSDHDIQDIAEYRTGLRDMISVITHDIGYVNGKLSDGQFFFADIQKEGILLYDAGNTLLVKKRELAPEEKKAMAQDDFDTWFMSAQEFLIDANNAFNRGSLKQAAFYLHQSAERTYNAVILVFRGYKPKTHNLDKLYRYTKHYSVKLAAVFPRHTKEEKELYTLLKKGYIEARYDKKYLISELQVRTLIDRLGQLQAITEVICRERIVSYGKPND